MTDKNGTSLSRHPCSHAHSCSPFSPPLLSVSAGGGSVIPPKNSFLSPTIISKVLELAQIWKFQHKNCNFMHAGRAHFLPFCPPENFPLPPSKFWCWCHHCPCSIYPLIPLLSLPLLCLLTDTPAPPAHTEKDKFTLALDTFQFLPSHHSSDNSSRHF